LAQYLVPIMNAASTLGRTLPPFLADRLGRFNVFLSMALLSAVITLALWVPGTGTAATVVFSIIFGFSSGAVASILPACVAQISHIHEIGVRTGALFSVAALATLVGSPVAGQVIANDGYRSMQAFGGAMLAGGFVIYAVLWVRLGGFKWNKI
jgi:MFS family permease